MKMLFRLAAGLALGALAATTAAAQDKPINVGVIYLDAQGYYAGVRAGIQKEAAALGKNVNVIETNARGDVSKESSFINTLLAAHINALIMSAVSSEGSVRSVQHAHAAGVPVICYNTCVNDATIKSSVYAYAVGDPLKFGEKIGAKVADYIKSNQIKQANIGVVNCEQYEVCAERRKGFEKALKDAGLTNWKIVANQEGTELDKAVQTGEQMLTAHPEINIMFGESGGATLGAVKAVRSVGRVGKVSVFGSDMTTEIAQELEKHDVLMAEVDISGKAMGKLALDLALKAVNGVKLDNKIVQAPIDLYSSTQDAKNWLKVHPNGLP